MAAPVHEGEQAGVPGYLNGGSAAPAQESYQSEGHSTAIETHAYGNEKVTHHPHLQLDGEGVHKVDSRGNSLHDHEKGPTLEDGVLVGEKRGANVVVLGGLDPTSKDGMVHRRLQTRHVSMIAIGGCIGTGLFVGSGEAYASAGPLGILLGYSIMCAGQRSAGRAVCSFT